MNKANRSIHLFPHLKEKFYQVKNRVLKNKGIPDGTDTQFLPGKTCWSCVKGVFYHFSGDTELCYKCGGTGWYILPKIVLLQRYRYKGHCFHVPLKSVSTTKKHKANIVGYIKHDAPKYALIHILLFLIRHEPLFIIQFISKQFPAWVNSFSIRYILYKRRKRLIKIRINPGKIYQQQFEDDLPF